jgi:hypothetical protein
VLDVPATAQALANAVLRGLDCGAVDEPEALAATGLSRERLLALARRSGGPTTVGSSSQTADTAADQEG